MPSAIKQKQRLPMKDKIGDSDKAKAWRKANVDYYAEINNAYSVEKKEMLSLYRIASGNLDQTAYTYITNPLNTNKEDKKQFPARLRNYDIISPILMLLLGEKIERPSKPTVVAVNSDFESVKLEYKKKLILENLYNTFTNELGKITGSKEEAQVLTEQEIDKELGTLKDEKAKIGQRAINYITYFNEIPRKHLKMFLDWLICGRVFSLRDIQNEDTVYEPLSPINVNYMCSENTEFVEDGEAASVAYTMSISDIIDRFYDEFTEDQLTYLDSLTSTGTADRRFYYNDTDIFIERFLGRNYKPQTDNNLEVRYVNWKSLVKIGHVVTTDIFGNEIEFDVDEDFIPRLGEEVEWKWVNQVWEGYKIDKDIYVGIRPVPHTKASFNNPSKCKLLINGRSTKMKYFDGTSVVKKLKSYQEKYNAVHWVIEKTMNKNKDKITLLPYGLVPEDEDLDMFDMLYYADAMGYLFVDETNKEALSALQAVKVLDLSLSQYIQYLYSFLQQLKTEAEELVGINRQRKGQTQASDGKYVTEESISRSSISTLSLFVEFEQFEERDFQQLLDLSEFCWIKGKKAWYFDSDERREILEIDGTEYANIEKSVFCKNTAKELKRLEQFRANAQAFAQNQMLPSTLAKILQTDDMESLIDLLNEKEEEMIQRQQEAATEKEKLNLQVKQLESEDKDKELAFKYYKTDEDNETKKEVKLMDADITMIGKPELNTTDENFNKAQDRIEKANIEQEKLRVKREEIASKERMNRDNNITKLKNPVSGERKR